MDSKKCIYCGLIKRFREFTKQGKYYNSYCKQCHLKWKREHYQRAKFVIDDIKNEKWKEIPNYEGKYSVSNMGRVKSLARISKHGHLIQEKILKSRPNKQGYEMVWLYGMPKKGKTIHSLVGKSFLPNPYDKKCINHIDGNKKNNNVENLEWNTHGENQRHAYKLGLRISKKGSKFGKRDPANNINKNWGGKRLRRAEL